MYISFKYKFVFLHIPKTAGTTIKSILFNEIKDIRDIILGSGNLEFSEDHQKFFNFHFKIGKHSSIEDLNNYFFLDYFENFKFFTIFRDPIDRVHSCYNYCKQNENFYENFKNFHDINDFIASDDFFLSDGINNIYAPQFNFIRLNYKEYKNIKIYKTISKLVEHFNFMYNLNIKSIPILNQSTKTLQKVTLSNSNLKRVSEKYYKDFVIWENLSYNEC